MFKIPSPDFNPPYQEIFVLTSPRLESCKGPGPYIDTELPCSFYVFKSPSLTIVKPSPGGISPTVAYSDLGRYDLALKQFNNLFIGHKVDLIDPQQDGRHAEGINYFGQQVFTLAGKLGAWMEELFDMRSGRPLNCDIFTNHQDARERVEGLIVSGEYKMDTEIVKCIRDSIICGLDVKVAT